MLRKTLEKHLNNARLGEKCFCIASMSSKCALNNLAFSQDAKCGVELRLGN